MLLQEVQPYNNLELLARQVVEGFITGLHKSPFHGFSVEFAEHRQYNPGENTRNIDWKLFARTDKLFVKKFEEETNLRCRILLDISGSMFFPTETNAKIRFSVLAAASICSLLKKQRDAFGITLFSEKIHTETPLRSSGLHLTDVLSKLLPIWNNTFKPDASKATGLASSLRYIARRGSTRNLIVIFSDMLESESNQEDIWSAIQELRYMKNEIILFHVQHAPTETDFLFDNRPIKFIDAETKEFIQLNPAEIRETYTNARIEFEKELHTRCMRYKIDFYPIDVSKDFNQVLLPFYIKRMRMS